MDSYRDEPDTRRKLAIHVNGLQEKTQSVDFEIENINKSIENPSKEKRDIDFGTLKAVYTEAQSYVPDLQRSLEGMVDSHSSMIQSRIDLIKVQLYIKQELLEQYSKQLSKILKEKEEVTIEILDKGLLGELNMLDREIEELSLRKGEIQQSVHLLEEQEQICQSLNNKFSDIEKQMNNEEIEGKIKAFSQVFPDYCQRLYKGKYLLAHDKSRKEEKRFPISTASLGGKVGAGKRKAAIITYDLAYMQYSIELGINVPQFVTHDKMEDTHINQLKAILGICEGIKGWYVIPVLRERIDKVGRKYIEKIRTLELSSSDKFFGI